MRFRRLRSQNLNRFRRVPMLGHAAFARRCRLMLEVLEDRTLLAWDLTISTTATANVTVVNGNFTANNTGANINVADLDTALDNDFNVVISNGTTGAENGNINWTAGNLDFDGIGTGQSLEINAHSSSLVGDITVDGSIFESTAGSDSLDIIIIAWNQLVLNSSINAGGGTINCFVNVDSIGTQGFTQNATATITTTNTSAFAVGVYVNTFLGGGGGASLGANITTGSGGTTTIATDTGGNTSGGSITRTGGTLDVGAGTVSLTTPTSASVTSVGASGSPILTTAGTVTASAGFNGVFITESNGADFTVTTTGGGGGDIELTCTTGTLTMVGATTTVGGDVTLVSDNMTITGTVFAGTALVNLQPVTASRSITLGTKPGTSLGLLQTDLNQITAGVIRIGTATTTGGIQVTAPIDDPATWTSLTLRNAGTITQTGGSTLTITNFVAQGAGGVTLNDSGNAVTFLAGTSNNTAFSFTNSGTLTVASLFDGTGIVSAGGDITLTADQMAINFAVNAGAGIVTLQPLSAGRLINLGTDVAGALSLTDAEIDRVTAGRLRVGNANAGSIDITAGMSSTPATLSLITGNAITQSGGGSLTATTLALQAVNGMGDATPLTTSVTNLAFANTTANDVRISNTGALTINNADTLTSASNLGGAITLSAGSPITFAVDTSSATDLTATANENPIPTANVDNITVNVSITVQSTNGNVIFQAGDNIFVNAAATVQALNGAVTFIAGFDDNDLSGIMTLDGAITGNAASGTVTLDLEVTGTAVQTAGAIQSANLLVLGNGFFDLFQPGNDVDTLAADMNGPLSYQDADALTIGVVGTTNGITTVNGDVTITTGGLLTIAQNIAAGAGTVTLDVAGTNQTGGAITAANLLVLGTGTFNLIQSGNDVGILAADIDGLLTYQDANALTVGTISVINGITTVNDNVMLLVAGLLTVAQDIDVGAGTVTLNAAGVNQTGGAITAANLLLLGTGTFSINQAGNDVGVLAANIDGPLTYQDSNALTVGTVGVTNGITTVNDDVTITTGGLLTIAQSITAGTATVTLDAAGVSQTGGAISAANLLLLGVGNFTLTEAGNDIDVLAANITGNLVFQDADGLTIGTVGLTNGITSGNGDVTICTDGDLNIDTPINAGAGTVRLQAGGAVTQTVAGVITALNLGVNAVGPIDLHTVANNISGVFAAVTTTLVAGGYIRFLNSIGFTVGQVTAATCFLGATGITTEVSNITLQNQTGNLVIDFVIDAGVGTVRLTSGGTITQDADGTITAAALGVVANGNVMLNSNNVIATTSAHGVFAANLTAAGAALVFRDVASLIIGSIDGNVYFNPISGVTTVNGDFTLNVGTNLFVNSNINLGAGNATMSYNIAVMADIEAAFNAVNIVATTARLNGSASGTDILSMHYPSGSVFNINGPNQAAVTQGNVDDNGGQIQPANGLQFEQIETFNGNSGADTFNVSVTSAGFNTTLFGHGDSDVFNLGTPGNSLNNLLGNIAIIGGAFDPTATDSRSCGPNSLTLAVGNILNIFDHTSASQAYTLGTNAFQRSGGVNVTFASINTTQLATGVGNNTVNVTGTGAFTITIVRLNGLGTNIANVATGTQSITEIIGSDGDDTINVTATGQGSITKILGRDRNNTFNVGNGSLSGVLGSVCIDGGQNDTRGNTTLTVDTECTPAKSNTLPIGQILTINDQSHTGDSTYFVNPDNLLRLGTGQVFFSNIGTLNVHAGTGNNYIGTITGAQKNTNITVAGAGANTIHIGNTGLSSNTTVTGSGGSDTIIVFNTGTDSVTIAKGESGNDTLSMNATAATTGVWLGGGGGNDTLYANMNASGANSVVLLKGYTGNDLFIITFNVSGNPGGIVGVEGGTGFNTLTFTNLNQLPNPKLNPDPNVPGAGDVTSNGVLVLCYHNIQNIPQTAFQVASFLLPTKDPNSGKPNFRIVVTGTEFIGTSDLVDTPFAPVVAQPNPSSPYGFSAPTVAVADVNQDGFPDLIVALGSGYAPLVEVFDGASIFRAGNAETPTILAEFFAYDSGFPGGVFVTAGNLNGKTSAAGIEGQPFIITGAGQGGGPHVQAFEFIGGYNPNVFPGGGVSLYRSFFAYDATFFGGVRVAAGDINNDTHDDIITGAGPGGGPHVKVFDGLTNALIASFMAYENFYGGIFVAAGDLDNNGRTDIMTGPGFGGGPHIKVFDGATAGTQNPTLLASFFAFPSPSVAEVQGGLFGGDSALTAGVSSVAFGDANGDQFPEIIAGSGLGQPAELRIFIANGTAIGDTFFTLTGVTDVFGTDVLLGGVNVAGIQLA